MANSTTKSNENSATKKATTTKSTSTKKTSTAKKTTSRKTTKKEAPAQVPAAVTRSSARPIVTYVEEPISTTPLPTFDYDDWGGDEGDRAQYHNALDEHFRHVAEARRIENKPDSNPMPFVELMYPKADDEDTPEIVKCFVSEKKSFMHLEDGAMQLSILSPVGKWIWENRNIKPGDINPYNGARVLSVGFRCLKNTHLATANV